jgi:Flp pilus assembly protein TadD
VEVRSEPVQVQISPASGNPVDETVHKARYQLSFETPETALRTLDESLPAAGQRAEIHSLRGQALEALGRLEAARDEYRIALELTPDPPEDDAMYEPPSLYIRQLQALEERLASQDDIP